MTTNRQVDRLRRALSDGRWHSLPWLVGRMRGYRISAAVYRLRHEEGRTIEILYRRKGENVHTEYRMKPKGRKR